MCNFQEYFSWTFQDLQRQFPGLSRTKVIFQDFPGPGILKKKIQDFPEFSRRRGNPVLRIMMQAELRNCYYSNSITNQHGTTQFTEENAKFHEAILKT